MSPAPIAEAAAAYPRRSALIVAGLLAAAGLWHLCVPGFIYQKGPGVFIDGPLPAVLGVALALWFWRAAPPPVQAVAACACSLLALLVSVLVLGTWGRGLLCALLAIWGELREGFRLPFSAVFDSWGGAYISYSFWPALRPFMLWGALVFVVLLLRRPAERRPLGGVTGRIADRWAFNTAQRRQMNAYRSTYLAAVRGGEAPPPPPAGLLSGGGGPHGLATAHLVLKIGLAVAGALGLVGGAWSLLGNALKGPLATIFWRGLGG